MHETVHAQMQASMHASLLIGGRCHRDSTRDTSSGVVPPRAQRNRRLWRTVIFSASSMLSSNTAVLVDMDAPSCIHSRGETSDRFVSVVILAELSGAVLVGNRNNELTLGNVDSLGCL